MVTAVAPLPRHTSITLYTLHPVQQQAMLLLGLGRDYETAADPIEELLYGGAAGGGKSLVLRAIATAICLYWPGSQVAVFRRTYPELEDTHIKAIQAELPRAIGTYHNARHEWRFKNGSRILFRHCKEENDVHTYMSGEWDALLIDEATHFSEYQLKYLRTRVRSTRPGWRPIIVYGTNPGGPGHGYLKRAFVDAAPPETVFRAPDDDAGMRRFFLRAKLVDNPSLGDGYRKQLEALPETERRALADGDWDVFAGQYFREWRRDLHVCDPFPIPADWPRWAAVDYGFAAKWGVLWAARDPKTRRIYIYREVARTGVRDEVQAMVLAKVQEKDHVPRWFGDPSMFNARGEQNKPSIASVYRAAGIPLEKGANARLPGWSTVRRTLAWQNEDETTRPPRLQIFSTCLELIRTLPLQVHDAIDVEDLADTVNKVKTEDDMVDCLRYLLMAEAQQVSETTVESVQRKR